MTNYELTLVLGGEITPAKKKAFGEKFDKLVAVLKGKIAKLDDWGKIDLAYQIKHEKTGVYLHYVVEFSPDSVKSLKEKLNMEEEVIRYLLIKKDK